MARKIAEKFKSCQSPNISFCNIAKKAQERGRVNLAIMLLENEPKACNKVPLLMKMGENEKALLSATLYGLVYIVLMQLKETSDLGNISMIIRSFPMANNLYKKYCLQCSMATLKDILNQEDDWVSQAQFAIREGFQEVNSCDGEFILSCLISSFFHLPRSPLHLTSTCRRHPTPTRRHLAPWTQSSAMRRGSC